MENSEKKSHIAILQSPGIGHLIPLSELAKRLALTHNLTVTILVPTLDTPPKPQQHILANLPNILNYITFPPILSHNFPHNISPPGKLSLTIVHSLNYIRDAFLEHNFSSLVVDMFGTDAFDVAKEFGVPCYMFYLGNALCLSLFWNIPILDESVECDLKDLDGPLKLPGCIPIEIKDLIDNVKEKKSDSYKWMLHHTKRYRLVKGIIVNSFTDLEPGPIKALQEPGIPPVYPIGPLIHTGLDGDSDCLRWLDSQLDRSVLYVSFGTGGTLSKNQLTELAHGLELSQQRFIWAVKSPNEKASSQYFTGQSETDPLAFLPDGFLSRTKGMGITSASWIPQTKILSHVATGGFLTHCGWNSILESIVYGVPFIVWPLYAEQKMNAAGLVDALKIALRPKANEKGLIEREEIAKVMKELMKSEEESNPIRSKIREVKDLAANALGTNGESMNTMSELANKLKIH